MGAVDGAVVSTFGSAGRRSQPARAAVKAVKVSAKHTAAARQGVRRVMVVSRCLRSKKAKQGKAANISLARSKRSLCFQCGSSQWQRAVVAPHRTPARRGPASGCIGGAWGRCALTGTAEETPRIEAHRCAAQQPVSPADVGRVVSIGIEQRSQRDHLGPASGCRGSASSPSSAAISNSCSARGRSQSSP